MAKYASIDIGSNTLLLLITDDASGTLTAVESECDFGRLGQGLAHSNDLHPDAIARSLEIARRYREIMDSHTLDGVACVGTQALREAHNRDAFVGPAEKILGCPIEIIAGEREAELVATAVICDFPNQCAGDVVCVDVGGASTEFIHIRLGSLVSVVSVPIGAVRLSETFLCSDPPLETETKKLYESISAALAKLDLPSGAQLVGSAGTATSIASVAQALSEYDPNRIHGCELSRTEVRMVTKTLLSSTIAAKRDLPGLAPKRADVIAGGVAIYDQVMQVLEAPSILITDRGVRWGLAYELAR